MPKQPIDITPDDSVVPIYLVELTNDELATQQVENQAQLEASELAKTERSTKLASAITKLKALGLTEEEAKIIIGLE
jgi:hypothetical protein